MVRRALFTALALCALAAPPALASATSTTGAGASRTHLVMKGQRLGSIAKRYQVTIDAVCTANGISRRDPIKPGQRLIIPERGDKDGTQAAAARLAKEQPRSVSKPTLRASYERTLPRRRSGPAWSEYAKAPRRKSYIELTTYNTKWRGLVIDAKGRIRPSARTAIAALLNASGDHPGAPDRLIRLLVQVSDTFGGRPLHIVSGYRTTSFFRDSRHKTSQAIDFAVAGVPNALVRDYLLTLDNVGVGYYPNSSFLHLDVRPRNTYWVDYAGPGEAPRRSPHGPTPPAPTDFDELAELAAETRAARDASSTNGALPSASEPVLTTPSLAPPTPAPSRGSSSAHSASEDGAASSGAAPSVTSPASP